MGSLRKFLAGVSVFALIFTITGLNTIAAAFDDVPGDAYYGDALNWAVAEGAVDSADEFFPGNDINRAEAAKMLVTALGLELESPETPTFTDVPADAWFYQYVETASAYGIVNGRTSEDGVLTGAFDPAAPLSRAEAAKLFMGGYSMAPAECDTVFPDVDYASWYGTYVDSACYYGVMSGYPDGTARPGANVNRAEYVTLLYRTATYEAPAEEEAEEEMEEEMEEEEEEVVLDPSSGTLMVSVAPSTPLPTTIPADAASVNYTTLALTASGDDVTVDQLNLTRGGLGASGDFSEVWLSIDGFAVGAERDFNSDNNASMTLGRDYIVIPEGETVLVDVRGSMTSTIGANRTNYIGLQTSADVSTNAASVVGSFPLYGNAMTTSSYTVGDIIFEDDGTDTTVDVGDVQVVVGEFELENSSNNNEDYLVAHINLELNGSAEYTDLDNVQIRHLNEVVSDSVRPYDKNFRFTFLDGGFLLEEGEGRDFEITADIVGGEDGEDIEFHLEDDNDLTVYTINADGAFAVDVTRQNPADGELSSYEINAGTLAFSKAMNSVGSMDIPNDNDEVNMISVQVLSGDLVQVEEIRGFLTTELRTVADGVTAITATECPATLSSTDEAALIDIIEAKIDDVKLWNGSRLAAGGVTELSDITADGADFASGVCTVGDQSGTNDEAYYLFDDTFDLGKGTHVLTVTADFSTFASANETFSIAFRDFNTALQAEYVGNGDDVADDDKAGSAIGGTLTIEVATLDVVRTDGYPVPEQVVKGANGSNWVAFGGKFEASGGSDIRVTSVTVQDRDGTANAASDDATGNLITGVGIYDSVTGQLLHSSEENLGADDLVQFDGMNFVVPAGGFAEFEVRLTLSEAWDSSDDLQLFVTGVEAKDTNNNDATVNYPNLVDSGDGAVAFTRFEVQDGAKVTVLFDSRNDNDYTDLITPTLGCSEVSCAVMVAELEFRPIYDDVDLERLLLLNNDGTSESGDRFGTFFLVSESTGEVFGTGSMTNSSTADDQLDFDSISHRIPKDARYDVNVYATVNNVTDATQTGALVSLYLDDNSGAADEDHLEIRSVATGSNIDVTDTDALVNNADESDTDRLQTHYVRKSIPTITYEDIVGGTTIATSTNDKELYRFRISAADSGSIEWEHVTFNVELSSSIDTVDNLRLYVVDDATGNLVDSPLNTTTSPASVTSTTAVTLTPTVEQQISAGGSALYVLRGDIEESSTVSGNVSIELTADADTFVARDEVADLNTANAEFVWSDMSDEEHSITTTDWTNGFEVDSFDTRTVNIQVSSDS